MIGFHFLLSEYSQIIHQNISSNFSKAAQNPSPPFLCPCQISGIKDALGHFSFKIKPSRPKFISPSPICRPSPFMPLASPIGSGQGIINPEAIEKIIEKISCPVIIDAGIGAASEVTIAMEMGCDGVLLNTAIAKAKDPILMAEAMRDAAISGRKSFLAGRIPVKKDANPSSPMKGIINS